MKRNLLIVLFLSIVIDIFAQGDKLVQRTAISVSGFVNTTFYVQDQLFTFGNGQNAQIVNSAFKNDKFIKGFDIRNTRLTANIITPEILKNWKTSATLEVDLFGGFNGKSAFAASQELFRLRMAYVDMVKGKLKLRVGQFWSPLFGNPTVSLSHVAFPLGYGSAGFLGWRFPGVFAYYDITKEHPVNFRLDASVQTGSWNETGDAPNLANPGNLGMPQFEIRFNVLTKSSNLYIVGHYDRKDVAPLDSNFTKQLTGQVIELGGKTKIGGLLIQGNIYTGVNMGHQFAALSQIQSVQEDLSSYGGWIQLGYDITKHWGIFGFYGFDNVDKDQALKSYTNPKTNHQLMCFMLKYTNDPLSIGAEFLNSKLTSGPQDVKTSGNQYSLSAMYKF